MASSQEVFALRKAGSISEAHAMALDIYEDDPNDEWNIKAYAWCLYDLTKLAVSQNDYDSAKSYSVKLESLPISEEDEILYKAVEKIKIVADPDKRIIVQAQEKSRQGNNKEALALFREALRKFPDDIDLNTQVAWELYKLGKQIFEAEKVDVQKARELLAEYIRLKNERPSVLHSFFLRFADRITDREEFNLISFLKLWNLKNLTEQDFKPYTNGEKTYPSSAEKVIQHGAKLILDKRLNQDVDYFMPYLDKGINSFPENIWLPYYKAKLLHFLRRSEEAIAFLIPVVKEKIGEFWTWRLLAELTIETDKELALSCYCKSLLCKGDNKYLSNVRLQIAELLIQKEMWAEAKYEIDEAIKVKESDGVVVSEWLRNYQKSEWYKIAANKRDNNDFYLLHKDAAEEYFFHSLPWYDSVLGDTFCTADKPDKPLRKIYVNLGTGVIETIVSDKKFAISRKLKLGASIKIKGEYNKDQLFQLYLLESRIGRGDWDIFEWCKGNVIQTILNEQGKTSAYRVSAIVEDKIKEGIIEATAIFPTASFKEGQPVYIKLFQKEPVRSIFSFIKEKDARVNLLAVCKREDGQEWDSFPEQVGIVSYINTEKGVAHFIVNKKVSGIIKMSLTTESFEIGSRVKLKLKKISKDSTTYYSALTCRMTEDETVEKLTRSFSGVVNTISSGGFADDVFIENALLAVNQIQDENFISGVAILNFNKKKGSWGWKAISIDKVI